MQPARLFIVPVTIYLLVALPQTTPASDAGPVDWFKRDLLQVISIIHDPAWQSPDMFEAQRQKIWSMIDPAFDEYLINPRILKRTWPELSPDQRAELMPYMSWVIKWKLIGKLYKYSIKDVVFVKEGLDGSRYFLEAKLGSGLLRHPIRFVFEKRDGHWAASDLLIRGYSLIEHYRKKFDDTYFSAGVNGLVRHLEKEVNEEFAEMSRKR